MRSLNLTFGMLALAIGVTAYSATVTWDGPGSATGAWDIGVTANWTGPAVYADGDDVRFNGSIVKFRNTTSTADITVAAVTPNRIYLTGGYGGKWQLIGGDVTGSTDIEVGQDTQIILARDGSYSFSGDVTNVGSNARGAISLSPQLSVSGSTVSFGSGNVVMAGGGTLSFTPSQVATLGSTVLLLVSPDPARPAVLTSNANAEWGEIQIDDGAVMKIDHAVTMNGADVVLLGDGEINMRSRGQTYFNGTVSSAGTVTFNLPNEGYSQYATIGGSGNWPVAAFRKLGVNTTLRVAAPEVFGDRLDIDEGKIDLRNAGDSQVVKQLWLGGVQQLVAGTYGSSSSGATFVNDTYFMGPGVVEIECDNCEEFIPAVQAAICALPAHSSAAALTAAIVAAIDTVVEAPVCVGPEPGNGGESTCEAYLKSVFVSDLACQLLGSLF